MTIDFYINSDFIRVMTIRNIIKYPNKMLNEQSKEVEYIDKKIKKLVNDMFETMYKNNGIGLAAVQIGVLKQVITIDIENEGKFVLINPKIISYSENKTIMHEGCLSVPNKSYSVERPEKVIVKYKDLNGNLNEVSASGLLSKCMQHEIDHLIGHTIVDRGIKDDD